LSLTRTAGVIAACVACVLPLTACGVLRGSNVVSGAPAVMQVSSGSFINGVLARQYTCYSNPPVNPPLSWSGAPSGTKSVAVVVDDSSAPITPYVYWIVFDIGPATTTILQGQLPPGARQARGSAGHAAYDAPCPSGKPHSYRFTVYALDTTLNLPQGTSLESAWTKIAAATIGRGRITVKALPDLL
jgi:Raf kinase inhibitor-like YbhB/YbcL family protein